MENASVKEEIGGSATQSALRSVARAADGVDSKISTNIVKGVLGVASLTSLVFGVRSAYKHTRHKEAADLARAQLVSGVGFASKALAVATIITVSGFSLFAVGVSWILDVNTPRQFGTAMKKSFGESLRLPQSKNSQSFEDLINAIEKKDPAAETSAQTQPQ
ncbi:unnamed protein product [Auanema sp. JU1783]|nr:unnamed protein product [Auanema sp. JU1783]